jgi:Family of unknown function (DUF5984)
MLFDFYLCPLEEARPWGNPPDLSLSWFGFTEGFYRLQVGSEFLLNYSDGIVEHYTKQFSNIYSGSFVDYYVVRLWEDILDILPDVLAPIPGELSNFLKQNENAWLQWESDASNWVDRQPDQDRALEIYEHAVWWQRVRSLDAAYLQNSPRIWMWSTEESVIISWNNTDILLEGIQVWSATQGSYCIKRDEFLSEVRAFHDKLMSEMAKRVDSICDYWERTEIRVDLQNLRDQQQDRETWLYYALKKSPSINWKDVLAACRIMSADMPSG